MTDRRCYETTKNTSNDERIGEKYMADDYEHEHRKEIEKWR